MAYFLPKALVLLGLNLSSGENWFFFDFTVLILRGNSWTMEKLSILGKYCMHLYQELESNPASQAVFMMGHYYPSFPGIILLGVD